MKTIDEQAAEDKEFRNNVHSILQLITDAHKRMATNRDEHYRNVQQQKINGWLESLTKLHEENLKLWIQTQ